MCLFRYIHIYFFSFRFLFQFFVFFHSFLILLFIHFLCFFLILSRTDHDLGDNRGNEKRISSCLNGVHDCQFRRLSLFSNQLDACQKVTCTRPRSQEMTIASQLINRSEEVEIKVLCRLTQFCEPPQQHQSLVGEKKKEKIRFLFSPLVSKSILSIFSLTEHVCKVENLLLRTFPEKTKYAKRSAAFVISLNARLQFITLEVL